MYRVGIGYDIHEIRKYRKLVVGGVTISEENGLLGHSDADVLIHAIMDALLGAAGLKDIGTYFPDNDPQFKDISSIFLLSRVYEELASRKYSIVNIDSVIVAEKPKFKPYIDEMKINIANVLKISIEDISIKATTKENMDSTGKGLSMEAHAVAMIKRGM